MSVLTDRERRALDEGKIRGCKVRAHERKTRVRSAQCIKDKCIEDFAVRWLSMLERHGVTHADARHAQALVELLQASGALGGQLGDVVARLARKAG